MENKDQPIAPIIMQQIGKDSYRLNKAGDPIEHNVFCHGLTKREHFAGLAFQAMIANPALLEVVTGSDIIKGDFKTKVAVKCCEWADELLKQLSNEQK